MKRRKQVDPEVAERRALVVRLRRASVSFEVIGSQLGVTRQRAAQIYAEALRSEVAHEVDLLRVESAMRIDEIGRLANAVAADRSKLDSDRIAAMRVLLACEERRARLWGTDAPARARVEVIDDRVVGEMIEHVQRQLDAEHAELAAMQRAEAELGP